MPLGFDESGFLPGTGNGSAGQIDPAYLNYLISAWNLNPADAEKLLPAVNSQLTSAYKAKPTGPESWLFGEQQGDPQQLMVDAARSQGLNPWHGNWDKSSNLATIAKLGAGAMVGGSLLGGLDAISSAPMWGTGSGATSLLGNAGNDLLSTAGDFGHLPYSAAADVFSTPATQMGGGLMGQGGALAQGAAGLPYTSPMAMGSITGLAGLPSAGAGALADFAAQTGLNTNGLSLSSGTGGVANTSTGFDPNNLTKALQSASKIAGLLDPQGTQMGPSSTETGGRASGPLNTDYSMHLLNMPTTTGLLDTGANSGIQALLKKLGYQG